MGTAPANTVRRLAGIPASSSSPSPLVPITTLATPVPSSGSDGNGNNGGTGGVNSTLYLFTFLTTLLLLLAVSCGIVVRSFVLRRRFHRRVEEAIAAGVLSPSQTGDIGMGPGGTISVFRRHIGEKPKMWEVWIDEQLFSSRHASFASEWAGIQPVAVTQVSEVSPKPKPETAEEAHPLPLHTSFLSRIAGRRARGRATTPASTAPVPLEVPLPTPGYDASLAPAQHPLDGPQPPKASSIVETDRSVQVAVLIAMPDPSRPRYQPGVSPTNDYHDESGGTKGKQRSFELPSSLAEEHELPEICIGTTQARMRHDSPVTVPIMEQMSSVPKS